MRRDRLNFSESLFALESCRGSLSFEPTEDQPSPPDGFPCDVCGNPIRDDVGCCIFIGIKPTAWMCHACVIGGLDKPTTKAMKDLRKKQREAILKRRADASPK